MGYKKIIFDGWTDSSLLYIVKKVKEVTGWGLRECKDIIDLIDIQIKNKTLLIDEEDSHYHLLIEFMNNGFLKFDIESNKKPKNHRIVAKRSKEYENAKTWVESLHPKKQAMIKLLIEGENGFSR